jgi:hypothetical protein
MATVARVNVQGKKTTWEDVVAFARSLEEAARAESVAPADGARLVQMVMAFQSAIGVRVQRPTAPPPDSQ